MAGLSHAAENVGVGEIGRHLAEAEGEVLGGDAFAAVTGAEQATVAVLVELRHGAAGVGDDQIRCDS